MLTKEYLMSMELLKWIKWISIFTVVFALPVTALNAETTQRIEVTQNNTQPLLLNGGLCSGMSGLSSAGADCLGSGELLVAAAQVPDQAIVSVSQTHSVFEAGVNPEEDITTDLVSGWLIVVLISLVGVVAVARRGTSQVAVSRRKLKHRDIAFHT